MARALRIERAGGRFHVTARGNERKNIFRDDTDHFHFLELLSQLGERFGVRVHAYVLMDNHYHLLLETPEANLSRAMHWLNASYCVWFNRRHRRHGHLLQGRFGALVVEDDAGWQEVGRYVHLNPVRVAGLALDKSARAASRAGMVSRPSRKLLAERLRTLREFPWSSYPGYAGYRPPLAWICQEPLAVLCGGRNQQERCAALRAYTQAAVRQGGVEPLWARLVSRVPCWKCADLSCWRPEQWQWSVLQQGQRCSKRATNSNHRPLSLGSDKIRRRCRAAGRSGISTGPGKEA